MYGSVNEYLDHKLKLAEQLAAHMTFSKKPAPHKLK